MKKSVRVSEKLESPDLPALQVATSLLMGKNKVTLHKEKKHFIEHDAN